MNIRRNNLVLHAEKWNNRCWGDGMFIHNIEVKGAIDKETRCSHYNEANDRIAIKFYCCGEYFPCMKCHEEYGCENLETWPRHLFDEKAVLCGGCGKELTINQYLNSQSICPACKTSFNPGCQLHYHFYFNV